MAQCDYMPSKTVPHLPTEIYFLRHKPTGEYYRVKNNAKRSKARIFTTKGHANSSLSSNGLNKSDWEVVSCSVVLEKETEKETDKWEIDLDYERARLRQHEIDLDAELVKMRQEKIDLTKKGEQNGDVKSESAQLYLFASE
jgi:hypothetical protein